MCGGDETILAVANSSPHECLQSIMADGKIGTTFCQHTSNAKSRHTFQSGILTRQHAVRARCLFEELSWPKKSHACSARSIGELSPMLPEIHRAVN